MRSLIRCLGLLGACLCAPLSATTVDGTISTFAGAKAAATVPGLSAVLGFPRGLASDAIGNLYVVDTANHRIRRLDAGTGLISNFAGTGVAGFGGDYGPAGQATLNSPQGVYLSNEQDLASSSGTISYLYIADTGNNRVRRVNLSTGIIEPIAGNGAGNFSGDNGPAVLASLSAPASVAVERNDGLNLTKVYIADSGNLRIRQVNSLSGFISTYAGTGSPGYNGDGPAASATLSAVQGLSYRLGYLYLADTGNHRIRRINTTTQSITTVAGTGSPGYSVGAGSLGILSAFSGPKSVFADANGDLLISDSGNHVLRRMAMGGGTVSLVAGSPGSAGYSGDGAAATAALLADPQAAAQDSLGNLYFSDRANNCLRKVDLGSGDISTLAGNGLQEGVDPTLVRLNQPGALAVNAAHDVFIADSANNLVRKVDGLSGLISTLAGTGAPPPPSSNSRSDDNGPANAARLNPTGIAVAPDGTIYISDDNQVIRSVDGSGAIHAFAGYGSGGDGGPAISAAMAPSAMCVSNNSLYYLDNGSFDLHRISPIDGSGTPTLYYVAGSAGTADGVSVTAGFTFPSGLAAAPNGDIYISDLINNKIRKVVVGSTSMVSTVCGLGNNSAGFSGDGGLAVNAAIDHPFGLAVDADGNIFFSDSNNRRARRIDAVTGRIETMVGTGLAGNTGDGGPAKDATINFPTAMIFDGLASLYLVDKGGNNVRKVDYRQPPPPTPVSSKASKPVAYPSPSKGPICFSYYAQNAGKTAVEVYNSSLHLVARFEDVAKAPGAQLTCTDLRELANGAYVFRVNPPGGPSATGKFKVIR